MSVQDFEAVIGLEVHVQLATNTKIFCGCRARLSESESVADVGVNSNVCPICAAHPGTLPRLNKQVVEYAVRAGLATQSKINLKSVFSRKNYFYPDLPKGYQISQFDLPICEHGILEIETANGKKRVNIARIHMEEDAGKNVHMDGFSLVNLNRAGVPLIEIVSGPDMKTSAEAGAYLRALYDIVTYLGVCDGNLQEGNFRCDANVSVMPKGSKTFGTRAEIKNVNSFRFVEQAIDYEIGRQVDVIENGGKIVQETRLYDADQGKTFSMRSKEEAHDYRYFPEPDLMPLVLSESWIEEIKSKLPELPDQKRKRYTAELGLSEYDANVLIADRPLAAFFDRTVAIAGKASAKQASNFLAGEIARLSKESQIAVSQSKITPQALADVIGLVESSTISSTAAKQVISLVWKSGDSVAAIVDREGLKQVSDASSIEPVIDQILAANPGQVAEYRAGKDKLFGFFVGQAMKATQGKANPALLNELIKRKLSS